MYPLDYDGRPDVLLFEYPPTSAGQGANMEAKDTKEKTALYHAAENRSVDTVRLLLERGADPDCVVLAIINLWYFNTSR